jgi:murein L,D-transpeptidase YafK
MHRSYLLVILFLGSLLWIGSTEGYAFNEPTVYYIVEPTGAVYEAPGDETPAMMLSFRDRVEVLENGGSWSKVRTSSGTTGYMRSGSLSNVWLRVSKSHGYVYVYRGEKLIRKMAADFGYNHTDDKVKRGSRDEPDHWRTPEGQFYITDKNPDSQYYKALVLNYPTPEDARRGLETGLISEVEYAEIVKASMKNERPPMDTELGGWIEVHGEGTGGRINWTHGCVAVKNSEIDAVWDLVSRGTPVIVE